MSGTQGNFYGVLIFIKNQWEVEFPTGFLVSNQVNLLLCLTHIGIYNLLRG